MREIEYESITMFLLRFNGNIRRVIWRYNKMYEIMQKDFDLLNSFPTKLVARLMKERIPKTLATFTPVLQTPTRMCMRILPKVL